MESAWANRRQAHLPLAQVPRCSLPVSAMSPRVGRPTGGVLEGQHTGEPHERDRGGVPGRPMPIRSASIAHSSASRAVSTAR